MYYVLEGQGSPVFLIHGLFGDHSNLSLLNKALLQEHYQIIRIDLRNHGQSPHHADMSFLSMAEDIEQLRQKLQLEKISLIGHSLGGKVAMTYCQKYPTYCDKIIILDIAPVNYYRRHDNILNTLSTLSLMPIKNRQFAINYMNDQNIDMMTATFLAKNLKMNPKTKKLEFTINLPYIIANYDIITNDIPQAPPYIKDILFIKAEYSDYLEQKHYPNIIKKFPNARFKIINNTHHWLHVEKPQLVNRLIIKQLQNK